MRTIIMRFWLESLRAEDTRSRVIKEQGLGMLDIKLTDNAHHRVLIIEAKKSDSKSKMEQDCRDALKQIVEQEYAKGLDEYQVICYGIAFYQKRALVRKLGNVADGSA